MQQQEYNLKSNADGLQLQAYAWLPDTPPIATVQIAHGLAEYALRYKRFAEALTDEGFVVFAHDHRGHGRSLTAPDKLGDAGEAGWDGLVADVAQLNRDIAKQHPGLKHFLFGHSMGSFAVQNFLLDHSDHINAAVLCGSTDLSVVAQMVAASGTAPSLEAYNAPFEPARTAFDWLSRDNDEVDAYIADPLCGFEPTEAFAASMMAGAAALGDADQLAAIRNDLPLLITAGDADPLNAGLALLQGLVEKYKSAGLKNIDTKFYNGARHEILNETNREEVTHDIIGWFKEAL